MNVGSTYVQDHDFVPVDGDVNGEFCGHRSNGAVCGKPEGLHGWDDCADWTPRNQGWRPGSPLPTPRRVRLTYLCAD